VFGADKTTWTHDRGWVPIQGPGVDRRLVVGQAVAFDALLSR
jgi:hypothetical protein